MVSSTKRVSSVARTCRKALRTCLKSLPDIVKKFKRNAKSMTENVAELRLNRGSPSGTDKRQKMANNICDGDCGNLPVAEKCHPNNVTKPGMDLEVDDKIRRLSKEMINRYKKSHDLDKIIFSLTDDENSFIRTRHQQFVSCMTIITLDGSPSRRTEAGKMFAELLAKKVLSVYAITRGIDTVLKDRNDYLKDYPNFFSHVAAIVAPLLVSNAVSFDYHNLKYACSSIRPDNSSLFFAEILQTILNTDTRNVTDFSGTLRIFDKWSLQPKHVPIEVFMPGKQINKFVKNDRMGALILAMAMFDMTRMVSSYEKSLCDTVHKWITRNIEADIIKEPCFVRTLSIATVIACTNKPKSHADGDFIDRGRVKLLDRYIRREFAAAEIRSREVECIEGCVIIFTALGELEGMSCRAAFSQLYRDGVICTTSLNTWKNKGKSSTRTATAVVLRSFFDAIDSSKSRENKA